jgi:putative thioredoxin
MSFGENDTSIERQAEPFHGFAKTIREIEASEFDIEVVQRSRTTPVVVCFGAPWSSPSRAVLGTLEVLAHEAFKHVCFLQVNVDRAPGVVRTMSVRTIPDVRAYDEAVLVAHVVGHLPEALVRRSLDPVIRSPATLHALQALHAFAAGRCGEAEAEYRLALSFDSGHPAALLGLGRLLEERDDVAGAREMYERIPRDTPQHRVAAVRMRLLADDARRRVMAPSC